MDAALAALDPDATSWARIAEQVGNRSAKVISDTYTHVLMDERELDYAALIDELLPELAPALLDRRAVEESRPR